MAWKFWLLGATCATVLAGEAPAQLYYGGYNIGPDYGAMLNETLQQQQWQQQEMQRREAQMVQQAMQNPDCWAKYQQHRAAGGQMSYQQFAYQYVATGGMTPDGIARYRDSERRNQIGEQNARQGLREAEAQRGQAQQGHAEGYRRNQAEAGNVLQGRSSWIDPNTGQTRVLPYLGPDNRYVDPRTGQRFARDNLGNYYTQTLQGQWYQMRPAP